MVPISFVSSQFRIRRQAPKRTKSSMSKAAVGVCCIYKGCGQPLRSQHFKTHFVKEHLGGDDSLYSLSHRKQYERVRSDVGLLESPEGIKAFLIESIQQQNDKIDALYSLMDRTFCLVREIAESMRPHETTTPRASPQPIFQLSQPSPPSFTLSPPRSPPRSPPAPSISGSSHSSHGARSPPISPTPTIRRVGTKPSKPPLHPRKRSSSQLNEDTEPDSDNASERSTDDKPTKKRRTDLTNPVKMNDDGSMTLRGFTFSADQVKQWREATRTPLTEEELADLTKKADDAENTRSKSKKRTKLTQDDIADIMDMYFKTDAKQTLIARLLGSSQTNVSNYINWIGSSIGSKLYHK